MKDIVISSKKIEKLVSKELKSFFKGKNVPVKIQKQITKSVHNSIKDEVSQIIDGVDVFVQEELMCSYSIEELFEKERG